MTLEEEQAFIQSCMDNPKALMLIATIDDQHIGNCSLMSVGSYRRYSHRCEIAIALYQKYCGAGIGEIMLQTILSVAKQTREAYQSRLSAFLLGITAYSRCYLFKYSTNLSNAACPSGVLL